MTLQGLHVRFEGMTASFRHPLLITGTQLSLPLPAYTNLLGMISACAGRVVSPREVRLGFEYRYRSHHVDLQKTQRWKLERGRLREHPKGPGLLRRQFHIDPQLDLYVVGADLRRAFESPAVTPRFGRSEDLAWIMLVRPVSLEPVRRGTLGPTLVDVEAVPGALGLPLTLAEWFAVPPFGHPRQPGAVVRFVGLPPAGNLRFDVEGQRLYHPSDARRPDEAVYIHEWSVLPEA